VSNIADYFDQQAIVTHAASATCSSIGGMQMKLVLPLLPTPLNWSHMMGCG